MWAVTNEQLRQIEEYGDSCLDNPTQQIKNNLGVQVPKYTLNRRIKYVITSYYRKWLANNVSNYITTSNNELG